MPIIDVFVMPPQPYRALVIDDDASVGALVVRLLSQAGWDVIVGTRFDEGSKALVDRTRGLDLVILDIKLPDGDGMDLIPLVRERRDQPDIVILTGYPSQETMLKALRQGVLDFIYKPFTTQDIANMLRAKSIRERQKLGIMAGRFERVDDEFNAVHRELNQIRDQLNEQFDLFTRGHT